MLRLMTTRGVAYAALKLVFANCTSVSSEVLALQPRTSFQHAAKCPASLRFLATAVSNTTSAPAIATDIISPVRAAPPPGLTPIDPNNVAQQSWIEVIMAGRPGRRRGSVHLLTGDPGTVRYTAPVYIPLRLQKGMLQVLLTDPWQRVEDIQLRRQHARLLLELLRNSPTPLTAQEAFDQINQQHPDQPIFGSVVYVRWLLEHMRKTRLVHGMRNPAEQKLGPGDPLYPRLYAAHPYQQAQRGAPAFLERKAEAERQAHIAHALKRLKRSKPPFPIFRRVAHTSIFQAEAAQAAMQQHLTHEEHYRQALLLANAAEAKAKAARAAADAAWERESKKGAIPAPEPAAEAVEDTALAAAAPAAAPVPPAAPPAPPAPAAVAATST